MDRLSVKMKVFRIERMCDSLHPLKVMNDVCRVAASKVRDGDLLVVVVQVDAHVFLQLLAPAQRGVHWVFVTHLAAEQVLFRHLCSNVG